MYKKTEDVLVAAILRCQPQVQLKNVVGKLNNVFHKAFAKEPRLLAYLESYHANYMKNSLIQLAIDYDVVLSYRKNLPEDVSKVVIADEHWIPGFLIGKTALKDSTIITLNSEKIKQKINEKLLYFQGLYEGLFGIQYYVSSYEEISEYQLMEIQPCYMLPVPVLRQMQAKSAFTTKAIWKTMLGRARVPNFILPFLAFSYLTQECCYDQRAFDEVEDNPTNMPTDAIPHISYGPMMEKRGICDGFAWAFWQMMKEVKVECICVTGYLKENMNVPHMWNMVKLDSQYYHVDSTWGIKENGVFVSALLQADSMMRVTHIWNEEEYPKARGMRFTYEYIEDYLAENGGEFLDDGANEKYMFPDEIVE